MASRQPTVIRHSYSILQYPTHIHKPGRIECIQRTVVVLEPFDTFDDESVSDTARLSRSMIRLVQECRQIVRVLPEFSRLEGGKLFENFGKMPKSQCLSEN